MKKIFASVLCILATPAFAQIQYPSPIFQNLTILGVLSGAGFSNYFASPPPVGNTAPNTGAFTTLSALGLSTLGLSTLTGGVAVPEGVALGQFGFQASGDYLGINPYSGGKYAYGANADVVMTAGGASSSLPLTVAARTLGTGVGGQAYGNIGWCFNDFVGARKCWANYYESRRYSGATGASQVGEWNVTEFGTANGHDPYSLKFAGGSYSAGLRLLSGGACINATKCWDPVTSSYSAVAGPASAAVTFGNNGSTFNTAINFAHDALTGADGKTLGQSAPAIKFASGHSIDWESCTNTTSYPINCAVDNVTGRISASQDTGAIFTKMVFVDNGVQFQNTLGNSEFFVITNPTDTAGVAVSGASASNTPVISPVGAGPNLNLSLVPKGGGVLIMNAPIYYATQLASNTPPTISSGFGTGPSVTASNGTWTFRINVGTGGTASSGVIGLPAATTGWNCQVTDITTNSASVFITKQTASTTTSPRHGRQAISSPYLAWQCNRSSRRRSVRFESRSIRQERIMKCLRS